MKTAVLDIEIVKGETFTLALPVTEDDGETPVDLSGCTARAQVRDSYDATDPTFDLDETSGISGLDDAGVITLTISAADTAAAEIPATTAVPPKREGVWDFFLTWPGGQVDRLLVGQAPVVAAVTHD